MHDGMSPEEKLLKLIRKKNTAALKGQGVASPQGVVGDIGPSAGKRGDSLRIFQAADKLLGILLITLFGYLVYELKFVDKEQLTISLEEPSPILEEIPAVIPEPLEPRPFSYYAAQIRDRDIFQTAQDQKVIPPAPVEMIPVLPMDLTTKLKIVGIVLDKNSEVIVEDLEEKKTYFLHKGDRIRNAIVKEIKEGKVIFQYNNQTIELVH